MYKPVTNDSKLYDGDVTDRCRSLFCCNNGTFVCSQRTEWLSFAMASIKLPLYYNALRNNISSRMNFEFIGNFASYWERSWWRHRWRGSSQRWRAFDGGWLENELRQSFNRNAQQRSCLLCAIDAGELEPPFSDCEVRQKGGLTSPAGSMMSQLSRRFGNANNHVIL